MDQQRFGLLGGVRLKIENIDPMRDLNILCQLVRKWYAKQIQYLMLLPAMEYNR